MISAAKKLARLLLASAAAAGFVAPAVSAPLSADPNVRQLSNRKNYEPGGKYFLFGNARGGVQKRNGKINIRTSPPVAAGNMETETVYFGGRYGYETKFGGHPWQAHGPFDETAARNGKGKGAGVADGFGATNYVYSISATKVHPANGYDGPQGGNFPPPKGARDIYSYSVSGSASRSRMVEPQKAPCVAGVSCPASPFSNHLPPGTETHSDRHIREGAQEQSQTARKNIEDAVRLARAEALRTEEIAKGITRVRDFEQTFHTDKPYGFTADQLAAFGRGEVSPLGWLVANGTGVEHSRIRPEYITPEYIGPTGGNTVPDWIRQPLKQDADVLAKTANALTRQGKAQLTEWDGGRSFPANAAQKVAGAAGIIKTARDGLAETTVGKKIGAATDAVTPDALKNGIGKLVDAGNRQMAGWAGNDPNRKAYAAAAGGVIGIVADSRLPGKGRGKNRHKHSGDENPNHGGQTHDRADLDGGRNTHTPPRTRSRTSEADTRPNRPEANRTDDRVPEAPRARDTNRSGASGSRHRGGQPESGKRQPEYAKAGRADRPDSKTCSFHAGTLVKTQTGYKAIADIKAGDKVLSKNGHNGETGYKTVTAQYSNPYAETVYVHIADAADQSQTLIANKIHPFYTNGRWIEAGGLKAGDVLLAENGSQQTVQSVVIKAEPLKAYNLTVQDFHTYFVKGKGAETDAVWVHNECDTADKSTGTSPKKEIVTTNLGNKIDITPTNNHSISPTGVVPPLTGQIPNSSIDIYSRNGNFVTRRFYDANGNIKRDVHMTDHGNPALHPEVPHEHYYEIDKNGKPRQIK